ncbi:immunity 49 family protein [Streptomyces sp. OfavH-34-F]|uniref:immunity 49 family protein n=1 Tax=Streptomyces sp. OfavH-34-F TaxID=2917760 RepID=UPI001EF21015|nr:immunity 49 family protein [Streptomyces sp. OfavH-34-F]MCG7526828.1 immunity 49 family protein [Streptomyces sp. OfavH-34-F]
MEEDLVEDIDDLERSSNLIDATFSTAVMGLRARCLVDPEAAAIETWESAVNALQVGSALFAVAGMSEGTVECRINRKLRAIPAPSCRLVAGQGAWLNSFWLALICRDQPRLTQLSKIPLERLHSPQALADEYLHHWIDTLQTWWLRGPGLADKLIATIETSDPSVARVAPLDMLQGTLYPPINLFYHYVRKDEAGFAPALAEALQLHKAYWTLNEERAVSIDGSIALGPLAIACLAHDADFPLDVESDYLPKHLLQRSWLGEFPT